MTWAALTLLPLVLVYRSWTYWVLRQRITAEAIPAAVGPRRRLS
jgi:cytochrome bd ubiquinol oxidase subunit II